MIISSWTRLIPFFGRKKLRKSGDRITEVVEVAPESLEQRVVLTTINYNASTDLLHFAADAGDNDNVQVSQPSANTFRIQVGNSDVIVLSGGAVANADFVLSTTVTLNDTLTINTNPANSPVATFTVDLAGGTNQINSGALSLSGMSITNGGTVTLSTITVGTGGLSVTGNSITLNGVVTANNGSDVSLRTNGALATNDLTINNGITLTGGNGNLSLIAADSILQTNGSISLQGSGQLNVTAGLGTGVGTLTMTGTASVATIDGVIQIVAAGNISAGPISNNTGGIFLTSSDSAVTLNGLITSTGDAIAIQADQGITLNSNVSAGTGGSISLNADVDKNGTGDFVISTTGMVLTQNGQITIIGADIDLNSGTVNSGTSDVLLQPSQANGTVSLGSDTGFGLTLSDLLKVTAGSLEIGSVTAGDIIFTSAISGLHTNTLVFVTGGDVKQNAGATVSVSQFGIVTNGMVLLTENNDVSSLAISLVTPGEPISFTNAHDLTIGTVGGIPGISTVVGDVSLLLTGAGSRLTLNNDITTDLGANVTLVMDDLTLNANIDSGSNQFSISPFTPGRAIDLGTNTPGTMGLTDLELDRIRANRLQVGSDSAPISGNITISAPLTPVNATQLSLSTGGAILDTNATNPDIAVTTLLLKAGTGIASSGQLTTAVSGLEAATTTGNINISNTGALTVGGFTSTLAGIRVANSGNISLTNLGGITLNGADGQATIQAGPNGGNVTVLASGEASDFTSTANNKSIRAASGSVSVTAGRDILLGTVGTNFDNDINADRSVSLLASRDIVLDGDADVASDDFAHATGSDLTVTAGRAVSILNAHGNSASLQANGTAGGDLNIIAGANQLLTVNSTAAAGLRSQSGDINLQVDRVALGASSVANAFGIFSLTPVSANWGIDLGSGTDAAANTLELSNSELNRITADTLRIGSLGNSGNIVISNSLTLNPLQVDTLTLATGGSLNDGVSGSLNVSSLKASSTGSITLDNQNHQVGNVALHSDTGAVIFETATGFTVTTVDGTDGVSTNNQAIRLRAVNGNITLSNTPAANDIDAGSATVAIRAGGTGILNHTTTAVVRGLAGVDLYANQINLNGTVTATNGRVRLAPANTGVTVNLGGSDSATQLGLTDAELDRINAPTIQVGDTGVVTTPPVSISGVITPQFANTLIVSGDAITQAGGSLNVTNLVLRGVSGIGSTTALQTQVTNLAFTNQTSGDVRIDNTGALTVTNLDGLTSASNAGGKISVTTHSPLTIATSMTAAGDLTLTALDSAGAGDNITTSAGVSLTSTGGNLTLQAGDSITTNGPLSVATADKTITLNGGFGDVDGQGAVTVNHDLNTVNTAPQILGGSGVDTLTINRNSGTGAGSLTISGAGGNDVYILNFFSGTFSRDTNIVDSAGANDLLTINGTDNDEFVSYDSSLATPTATLNGVDVTFLGLEGVTIDARAAANDTLDVQETIPGFNPNGDGTINSVVPLTWTHFENFTSQTAIPTLSNVTITNSTEGSSTTLSGTLSDPNLNVGTTFTLRIQWGDGTPAQDVAILYNQPNTPFSVSHVYVDDNPTATSQDTYSVTAGFLAGPGITLGANSSVSLNTVVSNAAPTLQIISSTTSVTENGVVTVTGTYADAGIQDTHRLQVNWGDGSAVQTIAVSGNSYTITHQYLDDNPTTTASDTKTISLILIDDDLGQSTTVTRDVQVNNAAPVITSLNLTAAVVEGGTATLSGTYSDVGSADTHSISINWGDGSAPVVIAVSGGSFLATHVYADDNPSGTQSDTKVVTVTLSDDDSGTDSSTRSIIINNVSPVLSNVAITPPTLNQNGTTTLTGAYSDVGLQDTHTLDINWGDGSLQTVSVSGGSFSVPHQYLLSSPPAGFTVTVTLRDDDAGVGTGANGTATVSLSTLVNNLPPSFVGSLGLSASSINENGTVTLTGAYTDPGPLDTHTLLINWGDGTTPQLVNVTGGTFSVPHKYLDDNPTATLSDLYSITVTLSDNSGSTATASTTVTVNNVSPQLGALSVTPSINEGGTATLTGSYSDVGTQDTHTLSVNWGDGTTPEQVIVSGGTFSLTHQYLDAGATGTYSISVRLRDDDMAAGTGPTASASVTVNNVPPSFVGPLNLTLPGVNGQTITSISEGGTIALSGSYTDAGPIAGHTLTINWGDGTPPETVNVVGGTFNLTHQYRDDNPTATPQDINSITLTLTDSHGGTATASTQITVVNQAPVLTSLSITPLIAAGGTASLTGSYNDAGLQDTQLIDINWGDGSPLQTVNVSGGTFHVTHVFLTASPANGYQVQVRLRDDDIPQNGPGGSNGITTILVQNAAPVFVGNLVLSATNINENGSVTISGAFADPGDLGDHTLTINWGDGTNLQVVTVSQGLFSLVHQYLDDNPTGTQSDVNIITLTLSDAQGASSTASTQVTVNNLSPIITNLAITSSVVAGGTATLTGSYTDTGTLDTHVLVIDWGDGSALQTANVSGGAFSITHVYTSVSPANGYQVQVRLRDDDTAQNSQVGAIGTTTVVVQNGVPAFVGNLNLSATAINENGSVTLSGAYTDPGDSGNHTLTINWGDGTSPQVVTVSQGTFSVVHQYLDDNPTATASDINMISVTLTDALGAAATASTQVIVNNLSPSLVSVALTPTLVVGGTATLTGTYSDPGTQDTHVVDIDWGDGSALQTVSVSGGTFSINHVYNSISSANGFLVQLRLRDDDTAQNSQGGVTSTTAIVVQNGIPAFVGNLNLSTATVNENGSVTLSGSYTDPGDSGPHTLSINWGDSTPTQVVTVNQGTFSVVHQYLDDNPTGTVSDLNTILVTLSDAQGASATASTQVTVNNLNPVITGLTLTQNLVVGGTATLTGTYTDVGTLDTHVIDVNWGDGTALQTISVSGGTFSLNHVYSATSPANGFQVQVRLRDDDISQNSQGGATTTTTVVVQNGNPTFVGNLNLSATSIAENSSVTLSGSYADPGDLGNHQLLINWGDGTAVQTVAVSGGVFSVTHQYLDDNPTGTASDVNTITATIQDSSGGSASATTTVTVNNVNPVATIVGAPSSVGLNVPVTLTSNVSDVGTTDAFTYSWTVTRNGVSYATGNLPGLSFTPTLSGTYTVSLAVVDDDLGTSGINASTVTIQVNDVTPPQIDIPAVTVSGKPTEVTLNAVDPDNPNGNPDFTFTIDWNGDGVIDQTVTGPSGTKVIHEFNDPGQYTVRVSARKVGSVAAAVTSSATINVVRTLLKDGILYIGGTSQNDTMTVQRVSGSEVRVLFDKKSVGNFSPTIKIEIYGCPGNDRIDVDREVRFACEIYGQDGNDFLDAGGGNDYVSGGNGNDKINGSTGDDITEGGDGDDNVNGGAGRDIVIGGRGQDIVASKLSDDLLIGSSTRHDGKLSELRALQAEWLSNKDLDTRINNLKNGGGLNGNITLQLGVDVVDDGVQDRLTSGLLDSVTKGTPMRNWFLSFGSDKLKKYKNDRVN